MSTMQKITKRYIKKLYNLLERFIAFSEGQKSSSHSVFFSSILHLRYASIFC